jgi:hypothetical protein
MCGRFVMCGLVYVWAFCNVWVCVCVGVLIKSVLALFCIVCTVFFVLFNLYIFIFISFFCKDYCHRVTTQLQLIIIIILNNNK